MLFLQQGACDSIAGYGIRPLRTNRARNDLEIGGSTGLQAGYDNLHAPPGPGKSYSKPLEVKRGETYLLVLDNIYPNGKGHRILIRYIGAHSYSSVTTAGTINYKPKDKTLSARIYAMERISVGFVRKMKASRQPGTDTQAEDNSHRTEF